MDSVKSFNAELSSLYEFKPPISKAKMTALTRGAIKAIKFYKHVVQSVEKFILKCKSEYKIPGLYVIDSIVRQSRHQFGTDKDVFAPRFAKNIQQTFVNLYKCPPEDKSKIIRVLNLWQKNQVFPPDVIQPLFDLADPNNPIYKELGTPVQANGHNSSALPKGSPAPQKTPTKTSQSNESQQGAVNLNLTDPNVLMQLQQLQRLITRTGGDAKNDGQVHFDKKLLDFDYGDEEEEVNPSPKPVQAENPVASLLTNPEVLRQLQTLQQTMAIAQELDADKLRKLQEMKQQEEEFDKHLAQTVPNLPFASECEFKPGNTAMTAQGYYMPQQAAEMLQQQQLQQQQAAYMTQMTEQANNDNDNDVEVITVEHADSSRSPSQERSNRRRRSRTRSRDRRRRRSRTSSRSRSKRHRSRSRDRDRDRGGERKEKETERDKERKKRGLPAIKKENLSVCSTTLWVGHLSKLVHQDDLSNTFGEFGDIVSIDLIPPRGCAFIVMHRRQDAARCLTKLKNHVIHGKAITLAWAPGKGVKGKDLKDYWEGDLGVSYIPWSKIKPDIDLDMLEDGGMIDEDTMPDWMRAKIEGSAKHQPSLITMPDLQGTTVDTSQPPPIPGAGLLQPPLSLPMVPPFQFNNRLLAPPNMLNLPPGMMPNVPMGVPPPNIQSQLMTNPLLGIGSPFQGASLIPPPPITMPTDNNQGTPESNMKNLTDSLISLSQSFGMVPQQPPPSVNNMMQEDNMDVEMEDAGREPMHHDPRYNAERERNREERERVDRRDRDRDRERDGRNRDRDRRRSRSRERERERERDRERDRDRNRDRDRRGNSRDRNDRDRDGGRGRDRRDRGRPNRWGDRDKEEEPSDRKEKERSLNERLQEMAGGGSARSSRDKKDNAVPSLHFQPPPNVPPPPLENKFPNGPPDNQMIMPNIPQDMPVPEDQPQETGKLDFIPGPGAALDDYPPGTGPIEDFIPPDMPPMGVQKDAFPPPMRGPPMGFDQEYPMDDFGPRGPPPMMDDFRPPMDDFRPPMDDFRPPMDEFGPPPMDNYGDEFGPMFDGPMDEFDGPMPMRGGRRGRMFDGGFGRRGRRGDFRGRGPRGPPEFFDEFGPPRDEFGPPPMDEFAPPMGDFGPDDEFGPRDRFGPRGGRMRGGPPRMRGPMGRGFQRGGPRGRHGPWNDRNFNPRFDGPPEFFRGGRPPREMFDDGPPPMRRWGGRFEDERGEEFPPDDQRQGGRKSRWTNNRGPEESDGGPPGDEQGHEEREERGVTPLRDEVAAEPQEAPSQPPPAEDANEGGEKKVEASNAE